MRCLYNIEHYGGLLKLLYLRLTRHRFDEAILLASQNENKEELHSRLIKSGLFDKILIHDQKIGKKEKTEENVINSLVNYYDELFENNNLDLFEFDKIYTNRDCDNSFGVYLELKGINQVIVEGIYGQTANVGTYEISLKKGRVSEAYANLQKKLGVLCGEGTHCSVIKYTYNKCDEEYQYDFEYCCTTLPKEDKQLILSTLFPNYSIFHNPKCQLIIANSHAYDRYTPFPKNQVVLAYQLIADYVCDNNEPIVIKPHPEAALMFEGHFKPESIVDGSYPIDAALLDDDFDINKTITIRSAGIRFITDSKCKSIITLGLDFLFACKYIIELSVLIKIKNQLGIFNDISQNVVSENVWNHLKKSEEVGPNSGVFNIISDVYDLENTLNKYPSNYCIALINTSVSELDCLPEYLLDSMICLQITYNPTMFDSLVSSGVSYTFFFTDNAEFLKTLEHYTNIQKLKYCKTDINVTAIEKPSLIKTHPSQELINSRAALNNNLKRLLKNKDYNEFCKYLSEPYVDGEGKYLIALFFTKKDNPQYNLTKSISYCRKSLKECYVNSFQLLCNSLLERRYNRDYEEVYWLINQYPTLDSVRIKSILYEFGYGVEKNISQAISLIEYLVVKGDEKAKSRLFDLLLKSEVEEDLKRAFELGKEIAIETNGSGAYYKLARLYYSGKGTEKNVYEAIECMRKSAKMGYWRAKSELLDLLYVSTELAHKEELVKLYTEEYANDPKAMFYMSHLYRDGIIVNRNIDVYEELLKKASSQGYKPAQKELGERN